MYRPFALEEETKTYKQKHNKLADG